MAGQTLSVGFKNSTDRTWTMGIYQTLPSSPGLVSVAWKQTSSPQGGQSSVRWTVDYNVAIANYFQEGAIGVYESSQVLPSLLGKAWEVVYNAPVQELQPAGDAPQRDQIIINNKSGRNANLGIGMSGVGSVFKSNVNSGAQAQFVVTPTYWAALFNDVVLGQVISSNVTIMPLMLEFAGGITRIDLEAWLEGQTLRFGEVNTGNFVSTPLTLVHSRLALLSQGAGALQAHRAR